ncbi:MAG: hypothetical protein ACREI3_08120 [Nitrospirales bacterium]
MDTLALIVAVVALVLAIVALKRTGGIGDLRQQLDSLSGDVRHQTEAMSEVVREKTADALSRLEQLLRRKEGAMKEGSDKGPPRTTPAPPQDEEHTKPDSLPKASSERGEPS